MTSLARWTSARQDVRDTRSIPAAKEIALHYLQIFVLRLGVVEPWLVSDSHDTVWVQDYYYTTFILLFTF